MQPIIFCCDKIIPLSVHQFFNRCQMSHLLASTIKAYTLYNISVFNDLLNIYVMVSIK